jgi:hypothetical protein
MPKRRNRYNRKEQKIVAAVHAFYIEMRDAMLEAYADGKEGWDDRNCKYWNGDFDAEIVRRVKGKVRFGIMGEDDISIANYMMMLRYLRTLRASRKEGGQ